MKTFYFPLIFIVLLGCTESASKKNVKRSINTINATDTNIVQLHCQILWYGDCSYQLCETKGWMANPDSTQIGSSRILVFYNPDRTINPSKPIGIYSSVILKELYGNISLNGFLEGEKKRALENGEKVINGDSIKTSDYKIAAVKKYFIEAISEYYAIAYIDELKYIIMVVFTAKDINDYNTNYKSFIEIVQSYKYMGINIKMSPSPK